MALKKSPMRANPINRDENNKSTRSNGGKVTAQNNFNRVAFKGMGSPPRNAGYQQKVSTNMSLLLTGRQSPPKAGALSTQRSPMRPTQLKVPT